VSEEVRAAVITVTDVMRERLVNVPTKISEPTFGVRESWDPPWNRGRSYLRVFTDFDGRAGHDLVVGLAIVIPGKKEFDFERRVTVSDFTEVAPYVDTSRLRARLGRQFADALNEGPSSSDARARRLIDALRAEAPNLSDLLDELTGKISRRLPDGHAGEIRAHEKDGVNTLLRAFGPDHAILREAGLVSPDAPFLSAIPDETRMINHDWLHFRDWFSSDPEPQVHGTLKFIPPVVEFASFRTGKQELLVYNANNGRVEDITGVDLMYYNAHDKCFVMVQYKKFELEGSEQVIRPNDRLCSQLSRMKKIDDQCEQSADAMDIRLHPKPCFLKLCQQEDPAIDSIDMIKGMYLTREHFELILNSPGRRGPRGGRRINETTPPRHLDNNTFTRLLAYGWIGSCGVGTEFVREQVWNSLRQRGSVVFGTHAGSRPLGNGYSQQRDNDN